MESVRASTQSLQRRAAATDTNSLPHDPLLPASLAPLAAGPIALGTHNNEQRQMAQNGRISPTPSVRMVRCGVRMGMQPQ